MEARFSADEIAEMALEIERLGAAFYEEALQHVESGPVRELFALLREEESIHEAQFAAVIRSIREGPAGPPLDPEWTEYIRALAECRVFPDRAAVSAAVEGVSSEAGALRLALQFEREAVLFFHEMKNAVSAEALPVLDVLIEQERGHVHRLVEMFRERVLEPMSW